MVGGAGVNVTGHAALLRIRIRPNLLSVGHVDRSPSASKRYRAQFRLGPKLRQIPSWKTNSQYGLHGCFALACGDDPRYRYTWYNDPEILWFTFSSQRQLGGKGNYTHEGCYDAIKLHDSCFLSIRSGDRQHRGGIRIRFHDTEGRRCSYAAWKEQQETPDTPIRLLAQSEEGQWHACDVEVRACLVQLQVEVSVSSYGRVHYTSITVAKDLSWTETDRKWKWLEPEV